MTMETTISSSAVIALLQTLPALVAAGKRTAWRFAEFFLATICNPNTRGAYLRAVTCFFG
jgi:hypothetical protein